MNLDYRPDTTRYGIAAPVWILVALNTDHTAAKLMASLAAVACSIADASPVIAAAIHTWKRRKGVS